jgi:hypothetical protein
MKWNQRLNFVLMLSLVLGALSPAWAGNRLPAGPVKSGFELFPDLEVKIEAFEDAACTKPIANGGETNYGGGAPANYVRLSVKNKGPVKATNFILNYAVRRDGVDIFKPAQALRLSLESGATKVFPLVKVQLTGITNEISATILANIGGTVPEPNKSNNLIKFSFTGHVVA